MAAGKAPIIYRIDEVFLSALLPSGLKARRFPREAKGAYASDIALGFFAVRLLGVLHLIAAFAFEKAVGRARWRPSPSVQF
jgi:hypothetical protein